MQFLVTFSEPVTGVTSGSFALANGAGTVRYGDHLGDRERGHAHGDRRHRSRRRGHRRTQPVLCDGHLRSRGERLPTTGLPFVGQAYTQPTPSLYFSTAGNTNPPGVAGTADDADIYLLERHQRSAGRSTSPPSPTRCRPAPTSTATTASTPRTSTCPSTGNVAVPGIGAVPGRGRRALQRRHLVAVLRRQRRTDVGEPRISTRSASSAGSSTSRPTAPRCRQALAAPVTTPTSTAGTAPARTRAWSTPRRWDGRGQRRRPRLRGRDARLPLLQRGHDHPGLGAVQDEDVVYHNGTSGRSSSTAPPMV